MAQITSQKSNRKNTGKLQSQSNTSHDIILQTVTWHGSKDQKFYTPCFPDVFCLQANLFTLAEKGPTPVKTDVVRSVDKRTRGTGQGAEVQMWRRRATQEGKVVGQGPRVPLGLWQGCARPRGLGRHSGMACYGEGLDFRREEMVPQELRCRWAPRGVSVGKAMGMGEDNEMEETTHQCWVQLFTQKTVILWDKKKIKCA